MVIAHELDAVRFVMHGFRRSQLFPLLLERDRQFGSMGRTWSNYQYEIPDQYQGRFERLRVIGDKRARSTVLQIARDPKVLDRIRKVVGIPIKVLHVTRNPFDNIATEARRHKMTLGRVDRVVRTDLSSRQPGASAPRSVGIDRHRVRDIRHLSAPHTGRPVCVVRRRREAPYLEACAGIVWPSPNRSRDAVEWTVDERRGSGTADREVRGTAVLLVRRRGPAPVP